MARITRFDHVGVTVQDLAQVTAFFVGLGLEIEGRTFVEGEFIDTVIAIPGSRTEIVILRAPAEKQGWSFPASSGQTPNRDRPPPWPTCAVQRESS